MALQTLADLPINLALPPNAEQGPRAVLVPVTCSTTVFYNDDLTYENAQGLINNVQGVYIDNSGSANLFTLTFKETGQVIAVKGNTQGYYPVLAHMQVNYSAKSASVTLVTVPVFFLNVPVQPFQWATA